MTTDERVSKAKRCPTCGETDLSKFGSNRSRKDKLTTYCLSCKNKKNLENYYRHHDRRIAAQREQYALNPERKRRSNCASYQRHREKRDAYNRAWKERNPESVKLYRRRHWAKPEHKVKRRAYEKQWRQTPKRRAYMAEYYQRTKGGTP